MEYITMEQEKIILAQKGIEEDRERFDKIMNDSEKNVKKTLDDVKAAGILKIKLAKRIEELNNSLN